MKRDGPHMPRDTDVILSANRPWKRIQTGPLGDVSLISVPATDNDAHEKEKKRKERKKEKSRRSIPGLIEVCVCLAEGKLIFDIRAVGLGAVSGALWRSHWNQLDIHPMETGWVKFKNPWRRIVRLVINYSSLWSKVIDFLLYCKNYIFNFRFFTLYRLSLIRSNSDSFTFSFVETLRYLANRTG